MSNNDNTRTQVQDDVIELGVASVETQGFPGMPTEGVNLRIAPGISED
ncbi:benenodin family lasso peptide [Luteimonas sp. RC10]|nr:benenodin family lasso peptide [Luteimonas sp. RC10]MBB3344749.1 hypothetical protein [Luteimonas sp. RC10]